MHVLNKNNGHLNLILIRLKALCFVPLQSGSLVDKKGKILVPGMYDNVAPLTEEEERLYQKIDFDMEEYCKDIGVHNLLYDTKARSLE